MRHARDVLVAVCSLLIPATSSAQQPAAGGDTQPRIVVDINLINAAKPVSGDRTFTSTFIAFSELATLRATYPGPSGAVQVPADFGGSVALTRTIALGASYGRNTYSDPAQLQATIPNPVFFKSPATAGGSTSQALNRAEGATSVFLAITPTPANRVQLRLFGGPTLFSYSADMVSNISYNQLVDTSPPQYLVAINGFTSDRAHGHGLGVHAGFDVAYFLTRRYGLIAGIRTSRGTATVHREPMSQVDQDIRVGSTTGFVGMRFRIGR